MGSEKQSPRAPVIGIQASIDAEGTFKPLRDDEAAKFPNLHRFITKTGKGCSAKIDVVRFYNNGSPIASCDEHRTKHANTSHSSVAPKAAPACSSETAAVAELHIIEDLDLPQIRHLIETQTTETNRFSFLQFLDDYFQDHPLHDFRDVGDQIPWTPSDIANQRHIRLKHIVVREFNRAFELGFDGIQTAFKQAGTWRSIQNFGPLNPVQRPDRNRAAGDLPPLALAAHNVAAWFDEEIGKPWRIGLILVDPTFAVSNLPATLKPQHYIIGGNYYSGAGSVRTSLAHWIAGNKSLASVGVPLPFLVLQDLYRLIAFEWMLLDTYIARDLTTIEWILQRGNGSHNHSPETYKSALQSLHFIRRRLNRFRENVREQAQTCKTKGRPRWNTRKTLDSAETDVTERVASELAGDFDHIEYLMSQRLSRLEQSIQHIASGATIKEAERTNQQNRILLVLAIVGTFFLPISGIAAIFSMAGNWAPGQEDFDLFWVLCILISCFLVLILLIVSQWEVIKRFIRMRRVRSPRRRGVRGVQSEDELESMMGNNGAMEV